MLRTDGRTDERTDGVDPLLDPQGPVSYFFKVLGAQVYIYCQYIYKNAPKIKKKT